MATWQESNGGSFLAGIGAQNDNAPRAGDNGMALGLIRQNNDIQRSGANNVGLQALQGVGGLVDTMRQTDLAKATQQFNQVHANAWATGDNSGLIKFAQQNPAFVAQAQQAVSGLNEQQRAELGSLAMQTNTALAQGPEAYSKFVSANSDRLKRVGADPGWMLQTGINNPQQLSHLTTTMALGAVGPDKMFDIQDKIVGRGLEKGRLDESIRSNKASESLTARGQNISAQNARISANSSTSDMKNYATYMQLLKSNPEGAALFAQVAGINVPGAGSRQVQLSDGRTVTVSGKLHGAGANAFYEGKDNSGNTVRVPANAIAAPATSAASAQNYAMKKDLDAISGASSDQLGFMTGVTGGNGSPSWDAEVRSRWRGGDQRQLYNATKRIQGKMQNQGIAAARDMGASGINTVAEAKMYFQGMPQVDYSSPEAMQQSVRDIQQYTDNYNQQYQVNVGGGRQPATQQPAGGSYTSKSGITFTVK